MDWTSDEDDLPMHNALRRVPYLLGGRPARTKTAPEPDKRMEKTLPENGKEGMEGEGVMATDI